VTTPERDQGKILLNSNSSRQRRRFSVGHELLHFLNPLHQQTAPEGFQCSRADLRVSSATQSRHLRQEAEANAFAIELLTPRSRLTALLQRLALFGFSGCYLVPLCLQPCIDLILNLLPRPGQLFLFFT
jgi:Zn-dependent peptidase ImmA (M78 family)